MIKYTLEECLFAKSELIRMGLKKEEDFYYHDGSYSDWYLHGEPMLESGDDDSVSAYHLFNSITTQEDDDEMIDWYIENGLM